MTYAVYVGWSVFWIGMLLLMVAGFWPEKRNDQ